MAQDYGADVGQLHGAHDYVGYAEDAGKSHGGQDERCGDA